MTLPIWPHQEVTTVRSRFCEHCGHDWPCPSQQYLDGIEAAVRALASVDLPGAQWFEDVTVVSRDAVLAILEGRQP